MLDQLPGGDAERLAYDSCGHSATPLGLLPSVPVCAPHRLHGRIVAGRWPQIRASSGS